MKTIIITLLLALTAPAAFAQNGGGSGAGNGNLAGREAYLQRLRDQLGARPEMTPEGVGSWCASIETMLRREESRANTELYWERMLGAKQILVDALIVAGSSIGDELPPRTKTIIDRGLMILLVLDEKMPDSNPLYLKSKVDFLTEYFHLIYQVIREYDLPLYIDYRYRHGGCPNAVCPPGVDIRDLERIALKIAAQQLQLATRFTEISDRVNPIGDPMAFLRVSQMVSGFVGNDDLKFNIFAQGYGKSCVRRELIRMSEDLWSFINTGDRSIYLSIPYAVSAVRAELDDAIRRIGQSSLVCYDPYGPNARRWP